MDLTNAISRYGSYRKVRGDSVRHHRECLHFLTLASLERYLERGAASQTTQVLFVNQNGERLTPNARCHSDVIGSGMAGTARQRPGVTKPVSLVDGRMLEATG